MSTLAPTHIDVGAVFQRHERAMTVVENVKDPEDRWTLLSYVVFGSEQVDEAMALIGVPKRRGDRRRGIIFDRQRAAVRLRNEGLSFSQIAQRVGYKDPTGAHRAYMRAMEKLTA